MRARAFEPYGHYARALNELSSLSLLHFNGTPGSRSLDNQPFFLLMTPPCVYQPFVYPPPSSVALSTRSSSEGILRMGRGNKMPCYRSAIALTAAAAGINRQGGITVSKQACYNIHDTLSLKQSPTDIFWRSCKICAALVSDGPRDWRRRRCRNCR